MKIRDIAVAFGFEVDKNSEKQAEDSIKGIKNLATKLLGAIGIGFSIAGLSSLASAAAEVEALKSQFAQVFGDMENDASGRLKAISDETGVAVNRMKGSFTQIAAFSKTTGLDQAQSLEIADRAMKAVTDSAAFYDRSIEDVTESMRSFLKCNFEQDAALGLSCTETTRNAAANALYSKSFKDLSEAEKQFTLLSMVEDANKASGAIGQAARESDTWTNQLGNLKQSIADLKAVTGNAFLKPAVQVLKMLNGLVKKTADGISALTGENGFLTRSFERVHAVVKLLKPAIDRMSQTISKGISKGTETVKKIADKFGGMENVLRAVSLAAVAFISVFAASKVIGFMKAVGGLTGMVSKLAKVFGFANMKAAGIIAVVTLLAIVIEDFINFMVGNDSFIGAMFEKAGISADDARKKILESWGKVTKFLQDAWNWIKNTASYVFSSLKNAVNKHMGSIYSSVSKIWNGIKTILSVVLENISGLAKIVFGGLLSFFGGWQMDLEGIFGALVSTVELVLNVLGAVGDWISNHKAAMDVLVTVLGSIAAAFGIVQAAITAYNIVCGICAAASSMLAGVLGLLSAAGSVLAGVMAFLTSPITLVVAAIAALIAIGVLLYKNWGDISQYAANIWNGIVSFISGAWTTITGTITNAINNAYAVIQSVLGAIHGFFSSVFTSIASTVGGIFSGILSGITNTVGNIKNAIVNGISAAANFIKGLPAQAVQWGAHFIMGLTNGIVSKVQGIVNAVKGVASTIKSFLHFTVPDEGPLTDYESWMPDFMKGLAEGISGNKDVVLDKVKELAGGISALTQAAVARPATATTSTVNNKTSNVTQNVNIDNTYSCGTADAQKEVSKSMKKSATDATTQMARALAYARG